MGFISLIYLFVTLFLVYRNAAGFCVLILYPVTLPNSLMSSSSFPVVSVGFSIYCITSSANSDLLHLPIYIPFISFLSLLWLELPILCSIKVVRVITPVLFLILLYSHSVIQSCPSLNSLQPHEL